MYSQSLVACICACAGIATISAADSSDSAIKRAITGVKNELDAYDTSLSREFFEALIGDDLHQTYEFRVIMKRKAIQCYYQEADAKTSISVTFEVVDSPSFVSSGKISATAIEIKKKEDILAAVVDERNGELNIDAKETGTYGFCFDNAASNAPTNLQILIDIWRMGEIPKYHEKQQVGNDTLYHAFDGLFQVTKDVALIRSALTHTRSNLIYDYYTRMSNLSRVTNFSILSIVLIVCVCFIQLRVVKRMFDDKHAVV